MYYITDADNSYAPEYISCTVSSHETLQAAYGALLEMYNSMYSTNERNWGLVLRHNAQCGNPGAAYSNADGTRGFYCNHHHVYITTRRWNE